MKEGKYDEGFEVVKSGRTRSSQSKSAERSNQGQSEINRFSILDQETSAAREKGEQDLSPKAVSLREVRNKTPHEVCSPRKREAAVRSSIDVVITKVSPEISSAERRLSLEAEKAIHEEEVEERMEEEIVGKESRGEGLECHSSNQGDSESNQQCDMWQDTEKTCESTHEWSESEQEWLRKAYKEVQEEAGVTGRRETEEAHSIGEKNPFKSHFSVMETKEITSSWGKRCSSDRVPVVMDVQLEEGSDRRRESYFKMNVDELRDPEVLKKISEVWGQETEPVCDDRRKWARGWFRAKQELKKVRKKKELRRKMEGDLEAEVLRCRSRFNGDSGTEEQAELLDAERRLKERELNDAKTWRLRSREKWLMVEEVPLRSFFTKLKAKWAKESMEMLTLDSGENTTDHEEILEGIHQFYQVLFSADVDSPERIAARDEVVALISTKLKEGESMSMSEVPSREEVERVIFGMKCKAPGHDGLTVEMIQKCWAFVGDSCISMIHAVWAKKGVLRSDCLAIIKLIHKGGDKKRLSN
ncbi:hypothetical protein R1sor_008332 [Riccia sorocarpa]|uniref:Trichohyalin-like n=1 Tax=Riccia sorocarpa TaxID=122646 RepID=A0ABD3HUR6_9MARC